MKVLPKIFFILTAIFGFLPNVSAAHTYHTSLTRMDFNAKEKSIEITIQLFTHDLVPTLERAAKRKIDLGKAPDADKLIFEYVSKNFASKNKKGEEQKLNWAGKELEIDMVFVYVEIPQIEDLSGASLRNTIFFESFPEQTNLVAVRSDDKKSDLLFKAGDVFKEIFAAKNK